MAGRKIVIKEARQIALKNLHEAEAARKPKPLLSSACSRWSLHDCGSEWLINSEDGGIYAPKYCVTKEQAEDIAELLSEND